MTCLEHLVENGICLLEKHKVNHDEWCERMKKDVNWKGVDCLSVEDLWTICQYVVYTAMAYPDDDRWECNYINHRNDDGHHIADCSLCGKVMQWYDDDDEDGGVPRFCWYCGAKIGEIE